MGKVSPPSIKYVINAQFMAEGVVDKPDVIGAIFGQTEGLLGEELELRELQKKGKIGRINVELEVNESKTIGKIEIPTSIDKADTTIIAAAIETIDRVGPCDAKFEIKNIEDVRSSKREYIIERAKRLLEKLSSDMPEIREMEQDIVNHTKTAKICEYGRELLPSGPDVDKSPELFVVEGRADVLALLKCSIKNVIAMNGTMLPKTISELSKKKQVTLFVDGDRGGVLIARDAIANANISFIARAPDGKEVEELTEKEIVTCLRNKMSVEKFKERFIKKGRKSMYKTRKKEKYEKEQEEKEERENRELNEMDKETLKSYLKEIEGTKSALLITLSNNKLKILRKVSSSELIKAIYAYSKKRIRSIYAIVADITVTPSLVKAAEQAHCQFIIAKNFATTSNKIKLLSF